MNNQILNTMNLFYRSKKPLMIIHHLEDCQYSKGLHTCIFF